MEIAGNGISVASAPPTDLTNLAPFTNQIAASHLSGQICQHPS